ncbi:MAG: alpha/beta hydrolase [Bacteroidia bacterium]
MKKIIFLFLLCVVVTEIRSQALFSNAFGDPKNPAVVFMHGGPGYNAVTFELGAANKLADLGYYVITFDQRGCGRSKKDTVVDHYKFNSANTDINTILKRYNVEKAFFIGHSWGGTEAIKYAELYPEKVTALILVSSPMNYQLGFKSIIEHCEEKFKKKNDTAALRQLSNVKKMDTTILMYSSACLMFAGSNGLYSPVKSSPERDAIYEEMKKNKKWEYASNMTGDPVYGFFMNEQYTTLDMNYYVKKVKDKNIPVYSMVGLEDGLFNQKHYNMLKKTVGEANCAFIEGSSNNVFLDQREEFLKLCKKWLVPPAAPAPDKKGKK